MITHGHNVTDIWSRPTLGITLPCTDKAGLGCCLCLHSTVHCTEHSTVQGTLYRAAQYILGRLNNMDPIGRPGLSLDLGTIPSKTFGTVMWLIFKIFQNNTMHYGVYINICLCHTVCDCFWSMTEWLSKPLKQALRRGLGSCSAYKACKSM